MKSILLNVDPASDSILERKSHVDCPFWYQSPIHRYEVLTSMPHLYKHSLIDIWEMLHPMCVLCSVGCIPFNRYSQAASCIACIRYLSCQNLCKVLDQLFKVRSRIKFRPLNIYVSLTKTVHIYLINNLKWRILVKKTKPTTLPLNTGLWMERIRRLYDINVGANFSNVKLD